MDLSNATRADYEKLAARTLRDFQLLESLMRQFLSKFGIGADASKLATLGQLIERISAVASGPTDLFDRLRSLTNERNWLVHEGLILTPGAIDTPAANIARFKRLVGMNKDVAILQERFHAFFTTTSPPPRSATSSR